MENTSLKQPEVISLKDFESYFNRLKIDNISKILKRPFTIEDKERMKISFIKNNGALNISEIYPDVFPDGFLTSKK